MKLFEQIAPPARQARLCLNRYATWHTWSADFRSLLRSWAKEVKKLPCPKLKRVLGGKPYDLTFSLPLSCVIDQSLARELLLFANILYDLPVHTDIMLFSDLLDSVFDGSALHSLFAFFRDALAELAGDQMSAFYAPLGTVGRQAADFPVHADLYIPQLLFNVFNDVPVDASGRSLFLSVAQLQAILTRMSAVPQLVSARIMACLRETVDLDRYEEFFELMHGPDNIWTEPLKCAMRVATLRIKLQSGQGYLIHDRTWLHGRDTPHGGVSRKRVHRLVFNTRTLQHQRATTFVDPCPAPSGELDPSNVADRNAKSQP